MTVVAKDASRAEIAGWPPTVDLPTAARAFGLSSNSAYAAYHAGDLPFTVCKIGRKLRAISSSVQVALGITPEEIAAALAQLRKEAHAA
jgi:hypothetical protein